MGQGGRSSDHGGPASPPTKKADPLENQCSALTLRSANLPMQGKGLSETKAHWGKNFEETGSQHHHINRTRHRTVREARDLHKRHKKPGIHKKT